MNCVLFDLDETLFDHRYSSMMGISALQELYPVLRRKTVEELEQKSWDLLNELYIHVLAGKKTSDEVRLERIADMFRRCGVHVPKERLDELSDIYKGEYWRTVRPVPGVMDVLEKLKEKNYKIGILTNGFRKVQMKKIFLCCLESFIDCIITSEETGKAKPDSEMYIKAIELCGTKVNECIMVGDAWETDILGAIAAGIKPVWINRRNQLCPDSSVKVIHEPIELLEIFGLK